MNRQINIMKVKVLLLVGIFAGIMYFSSLLTSNNLFYAGMIWLVGILLIAAFLIILLTVFFIFLKRQFFNNNINIYAI